VAHIPGEAHRLSPRTFRRTGCGSAALRSRITTPEACADPRSARAVPFSPAR